MIRENPDFLAYLETLIAKPESGISLRRFPAGELLLKQGEQSHYVFLVKSGVVKCFVTDENDKDFIFEFLGKGEIVGELEGVRSVACLGNVESITEVTALAIPVTEFNSLLESDIRFNHLLIHTFVTRIVHTSERAAFQQVNTTERSLTRLKQLFKDADLQLSKEDMAAYLGITVRSLNRTLKNRKV